MFSNPGQYLLRYISNFLLDINPSTKNGVTPMILAAELGQTDIVKFYIKKLQNKNPPQISNGQFARRTPLHQAAEKGHLDIVKIIANSISDKNPKDVHGITPLHMAAGRGHLEVVKYLTKFIRNVDIKTDSFYEFKTPVQIAAQDGQIGK